MSKHLVSACLLAAAAAQGAIAQSGAQLAGSWKLVSFVTEFQATGELKPNYGTNPPGYLVLTPEGRLMTIVVREGRKAGNSDEERAALHKSMIAYTGLYRIDGDQFVTQVDVSWNEAWTGTEQRRHFKVDGDQLDITSAWAPAPNLPGNPVARGVLRWQRVR